MRLTKNPKGARVRRCERRTRTHTWIVHIIAATRGPTYTVTGRVTS